MTERNTATRKNWIEQQLTTTLAPSRLTVSDDSHRHEGHAGWREGGETHYSIDIVSARFVGKSRVERHRLVNDALAEAFGSGLHALAIRARAPDEE